MSGMPEPCQPEPWTQRICIAEKVREGKMLCLLHTHPQGALAQLQPGVGRYAYPLCRAREQARPIQAATLSNASQSGPGHAELCNLCTLLVTGGQVTLPHCGSAPLLYRGCRRKMCGMDVALRAMGLAQYFLVRTKTASRSHLLLCGQGRRGAVIKACCCPNAALALARHVI